MYALVVRSLSVIRGKVQVFSVSVQRRWMFFVSPSYSGFSTTGARNLRYWFMIT